MMKRIRFLNWRMVTRSGTIFTCSGQNVFSFLCQARDSRGTEPPSIHLKTWERTLSTPGVSPLLSIPKRCEPLPSDFDGSASLEETEDVCRLGAEAVDPRLLAVLSRDGVCLVICSLLDPHMQSLDGVKTRLTICTV